MAEFRVRFVSEGQPLDGLIEYFEGGSQWSHTEIILPDNTFLGARLSGGVAIRPTDYAKHVKREKRYAIPVSDIVLTNIMNFAHAQIGKKYDMSVIFGMAVHRPWNVEDKYICSEFVTAAAQAGGLYMLNVEPDFAFRITPETLHLSPTLIGHCYYSVNTDKK